MLDSVGLFLSRDANIIWFMIVLPVIFGLAELLFRKQTIPRLVVTLFSSALNFLFAISLYLSDDFYLTFPFASHGLDMAFHIYKFSSLFLVFTASIFMLASLYSVVFLKRESCAGRFMFYLTVSLGMINGAFLSDNLGIMLFFWEGLLCTLFGILLMNNRENPKTAVKALALSGTADLLLMLGIILTVCQSGTPYIAQMQKLPISGVSAFGFVCILLGAVGKAGCMPFHSWIPSAADDAPTPFMVSFPGALEKLLGIYLSVRIVTDLYDLQPGSGMSIAVMTLGTLTLVCGVAMALIQKDMKRLLSYHAVSQVGYMVLGIGTALPVGIIGGLFHMLNNVVFKSCLFMIAGGIEKQTGTTDLRKIGGLGKKMPVTAVCFVISGLAISGVPPFNGFFSKELIFDAALESKFVFYLGALLGAFFTAVSFLKMGHAAFFGELKLPSHKNHISESGFGMLLPMAVLAGFSVIFGIKNAWPLDDLLGSALGYTESYSGWPHSVMLVAVSMLVLLLAAADHLYGFKKMGSAINAADHIHYLPGLRGIYALAEKGYFDPMNWMMHGMNAYGALCGYIERGVSWFYDVALVRAAKGAGNLLHRFDNGSLSRYLVLAIAGVGCVAMIFLIILF